MKSIYKNMSQYNYIDQTVNQNPPFGNTPFYKLGTEPDKCYKPFYNYDLGYIGPPAPKIDCKSTPWYCPSS